MICTFCNTEYEITISKHSPEYEKMVERNACFHCAYYLCRLGTPNRIIVNGNLYFVGPEDTKSERGYYGREFVIESLKPPYEQFVSTNLWDNGTVPAHFRKEYPDTHVFVQEKR